MCQMSQRNLDHPWTLCMKYTTKSLQCQETAITPPGSVPVADLVRQASELLQPEREIRAAAQNHRSLVLFVAASTSSRLPGLCSDKSPCRDMNRRVKTHEQSPLHPSRHSIRQPACPICARAKYQAEHEEHASRNLDRHCTQAKRTDQLGAIRPVYLRSVL